MQQPPRASLVGSCANCGRRLVYDPAAQGLCCAHCGTRSPIAAPQEQIVRLRVPINGQTGAVHGARPYSVIKIILFVLAIVAVVCAIGAAIYFFGGHHS